MRQTPKSTMEPSPQKITAPARSEKSALTTSSRPPSNTELPNPQNNRTTLNSTNSSRADVNEYLSPVGALPRTYVGKWICGLSLFVRQRIERGTNNIEYTGLQVPSGTFHSTQKDGENDQAIEVPSEGTLIDPTRGATVHSLSTTPVIPTSS